MRWADLAMEFLPKPGWKPPARQTEGTSRQARTPTNASEITARVRDDAAKPRVNLRPRQIARITANGRIK